MPDFARFLSCGHNCFYVTGSWYEDASLGTPMLVNQSSWGKIVPKTFAVMDTPGPAVMTLETYYPNQEERDQLLNELKIDLTRQRILRDHHFPEAS